MTKELCKKPTADESRYYFWRRRTTSQAKSPCRRGAWSTLCSRATRSLRRYTERIVSRPKSFPPGKPCLTALHGQVEGKGTGKGTEMAPRARVPALVPKGQLRGVATRREKKSANKQRVGRLLRLPGDERSVALTRLSEGIATRWEVKSGRRFVTGFLGYYASNSEVHAIYKRRGGNGGLLPPPEGYPAYRKVWSRVYFLPCQKSEIPKNLTAPLLAYHRLFHAEWKRLGRPPEVRGGLSWKPKPSVSS